MKIGILSESHGNVDNTQSALYILNSCGVEVIVHCGDIGSEEVVVEMNTFIHQFGIPIYAVLGNVDYNDDGYQDRSKAGELEIVGRFGTLTLADKQIAIIHGDDVERLFRTIDSDEYDYVFTGHTHQADDRQHGHTRVINPGAIYRATHPSVAVLDTVTNELIFLDTV